MVGRAEATTTGGVHLRLLGGWLCLDFVNTIENRTGESPEDFLTSYPELARWAAHAGVVSDAVAADLIDRADDDSAGAQAALEAALALRTSLHRVFLAIATRHEPDAADLALVRRAYAGAIAEAELARPEGRFEWRFPVGARDLGALVRPIAHSAITLLTTGDPERIKLCASPYGCGWLFYDSSKNRSRRWCSMEGCGSQVKMRRQSRKRQRRGGQTPPSSAADG